MTPSKAVNATKDAQHVSGQSIAFVRCSFCIIGIDSPSCKEGNLVSSKTGALIVLKAILGRPIDVDLIPEYPPANNSLHDTIIEAIAVRAAEGIEVEQA